MYPWKLSLQRFSISGSLEKGKQISHGKVSGRTVQNYVLEGKSKRIPFQRRGAEETKRKAEAKECCKYQGQVRYPVWTTKPHCLCILSVLEQEG